MSAPSRILAAGTTIALLLAVAACTDPAEPSPQGSSDPDLGALPFRDATLPVAERVDDLLGRMTLEEKIGQMTLVERWALAPGDVSSGRVGNVLSGGGDWPADNSPAGWVEAIDALDAQAASSRLGIPLLYAVDAVHGFGHLPQATVFPHQIGLGATGDPELVGRVGEAVGDELAALGIDIDYAPVVGPARDDRWGRTYEAYGEDPAASAQLSEAFIVGLQGTGVLATAKHYLGDGGTQGGTDRGDVDATDEEVRELFLEPYRRAVDAGVASVMVSFSSIRGEPMTASEHWVTDVLKGELGFEGFVVSDYAAAQLLDGDAGDLSDEDVRRTIAAGIDLVMVPTDTATFHQRLTALVESGEIPTDRIDDAVRRVLTAKFEAGAFERQGGDPQRLAGFGSQEHRDLAREAVARSVVVLANDDDTLPLAASGRVLVAGAAADDLGRQSGGWTLGWQGQEGNLREGTTILEGVRELVGDAGVTYSPDGSATGPFDAAVVVVGERPYAEWEGDLGDGDMRPAPDEAALVRQVAALGVPTVLVLLSGRPLDITPELALVDAAVAAWLPGTEGGGVTDVLFGEEPASGRLPVSWPTSVAQEPINDGDGQEPAFPLGWGIAYPAG